MQDASPRETQSTRWEQVESHSQGDLDSPSLKPHLAASRCSIGCSSEVGMASSGVISLSLLGKLPPEMWARVLRITEPTPKLANEWLPTQRAFWQLPLMCKTFRQILTQHNFGRHVCVETVSMPCFAIPSLLAWLKAKADVLETLQTSIDECFSAVYLSKTLTSVKAMPRSKANVEVLARFKTLQACYLTCSVQDLDLAPLQGLEQLTSLDLAVGTFANLDASRLTYLGLLDAEATLTAGCSKLIKLSMVRSALNERALLACTALRYLHIARCSIPLDMSSLAALRVVEFEARVFTYYAELQCICTLPSVSHLDLLLPSSLPFLSGAITAGSAFENLTKVTYLSLRTTHSPSAYKFHLTCQH